MDPKQQQADRERSMLPTPQPEADGDVDDIAAETKARGGKDKELDAIRRVLAILEPLDMNAQSRVLNYIGDRLGLSRPTETH